jgi:hypothetical protein
LALVANVITRALTKAINTSNGFGFMGRAGDVFDGRKLAARRDQSLVTILLLFVF